MSFVLAVVCFINPFSKHHLLKQTKLREISEIAPKGHFLKEAIPTILRATTVSYKKVRSHKAEETYLGKA